MKKLSFFLIFFIGLFIFLVLNLSGSYAQSTDSSQPSLVIDYCSAIRGYIEPCG